MCKERSTVSSTARHQITIICRQDEHSSCIIISLPLQSAEECHATQECQFRERGADAGKLESHRRIGLTSVVDRVCEGDCDIGEFARERC